MASMEIASKLTVEAVMEHREYDFWSGKMVNGQGKARETHVAHTSQICCAMNSLSLLYDISMY